MEDFDQKREQAKRKHQEELLQQEREKVNLEKIRRANAEACSEALVRLFIDAIANSPEDEGVSEKSTSKNICPGWSASDHLVEPLLRDKINERSKGRIKVEKLQLGGDNYTTANGNKVYPDPFYKMTWRVQK